MNDINIVVGDWSGDGHSQSDSYLYQVNITADELKAAYGRGVTEIGFSITSMCKDFEDGEIERQYAEKLVANGFVLECGETIEGRADDSMTEDYIYLNPSEFADAYMIIAKLGEPTLKYTRRKDIPDIRIGGYGLYS